MLPTVRLRQPSVARRSPIATRPFRSLLLACGFAAAPLAAATIVVDSIADDLDQGPNGNCTLREAIVAANGNAAVDACPAGDAGPATTDVVVLPAGTYTLAIAGAGEGAALTGDLDLTDELSIQGAGARATVLDAAGLDRAFEVVGATATLANLTVRGGASGGGTGGGILNGGTLTLVGCSVLANVAGGAGGGIRNNGTITILRSTLAGNTSADHGGGMDDHGTSTLENVTVSGNVVTGGGAGGGLYNLGGTDMTLRHVTLAGNSAAAGGALHNAGATSVANVLVVGACDSAVATSSGGNLESPGDSCGLDAPSDQVSVADPALGTLADNGGQIDSRALLAGSPAIDAAETGPCPAFDGRGAPRPLDGDDTGDVLCDIGAFERYPAALVFGDGFELGDTFAW